MGTNWTNWKPGDCPVPGDRLVVDSRLGGVFDVQVIEHVNKDVWRSLIDMPRNPDWHGVEHLFSLDEIKEVAR